MFDVVLRSFFAGIGAVLVGVAVIPVAPAAAQTVSREIVQPIPPAASGALNRALQRLARRPRDLEALLAAGNASLDLNDNDAAVGFFLRAREVDPANAEMLLGLAKAQLATGRPVQALDLFDQAEDAGVATQKMEADRGLAFDLVGDNARAQALYESALSRGEDAELSRRLALSHAISGNRNAFERVLYAQLERSDKAGFRARAFGLAILGEPEEAVKIAEALMPTDLALRMAPYLRYMPRLTKAQQAAAANLGVFPRAANIGRDEPAIANYAARGAEIAAQASASLTPSGAEMGARPPEATSQIADDPRRRRPDRTASVADPGGADRAIGTRPVSALERAEQAATGESAVSGAQVIQTQQTQPARQNVSNAFSDFATTTAVSAEGREGAVDIAAIVPPREVEREERSEPVPPAHPARHWVQVATGRDRDALRFDWRRIARQADGALSDKGPFVTPWGQANRLLAGPFETAADARKTINELSGLGLDTFAFNSPEGQEIEPLS